MAVMVKISPVSLFLAGMSHVWSPSCIIPCRLYFKGVDPGSTILAPKMGGLCLNWQSFTPILHLLMFNDIYTCPSNTNNSVRLSFVTMTITFDLQHIEECKYCP